MFPPLGYWVDAILVGTEENIWIYDTKICIKNYISKVFPFFVRFVLLRVGGRI